MEGRVYFEIVEIYSQLNAYTKTYSSPRPGDPSFPLTDIEKVLCYMDSRDSSFRSKAILRVRMQAQEQQVHVEDGLNISNITEPIVIHNLAVATYDMILSGKHHESLLFDIENKQQQKLLYTYCDKTLQKVLKSNEELSWNHVYLKQQKKNAYRLRKGKPHKEPDTRKIEPKVIEQMVMNRNLLVIYLNYKLAQEYHLSYWEIPALHEFIEVDYMIYDDFVHNPCNFPLYVILAVTKHMNVFMKCSKNRMQKRIIDVSRTKV